MRYSIQPMLDYIRICGLKVFIDDLDELLLIGFAKYIFVTI